MPTAGAYSNRNLIINGGMQVWQRATSFTAEDTGGYLTADRLRYTQDNGYGAEVDPVMSRDTDVPNNSFAYSFKFETTTGEAPDANQYIELDTFLEGQDVCRLAQGTSDATGMTLSFWVKSSIAGTYCVAIGSTQPWSNGRKYVAEYSISSDDEWERIVIPIPGDTSGTWDKTTNGIGLCVTFTMASGSDKQGTANTWLDNSQVTNTSNQTNLTATTDSTWFITGIQLEAGDKATPFEHRSYADELLRCQRYYLQLDSSINSSNYSSGNAMVHIWFPVHMREAPSTFTYTANFNSGSFQSNSIKAFYARAYYTGDQSGSIQDVKFNAELE